MIKDLFQTSQQIKRVRQQQSYLRQTSYKMNFMMLIFYVSKTKLDVQFVVKSTSQ